MRKDFSQRYPTATERLRFADVLVLDDRGTEAVPALLGIADEQERYGFPDKAIEALRRAAEDLARRGHAQKAVAVLKKVERIQQRGMEEVSLAPLGKGKRASSRRKSAKSRAADPPASRAVRGAAFRKWVGSLLRETAALAARATPSVEEVAEGAGEEQGNARGHDPIRTSGCQRAWLAVGRSFQRSR